MMKKLTESHLRRMIREEMLLQEISRGSVLYHRSREELEPGQKLGDSSHGEGAHERKAETEREFPDVEVKTSNDTMSVKLI